MTEINIGARINLVVVLCDLGNLTLWQICNNHAVRHSTVVYEILPLESF